MASHGAIVDTCTDDPDVAQLMATARWAEAYIPAPKPSRRGPGTAGVFCASLYAKAGADNERLFHLAFAAAAGVGPAPYFPCMDANIDINESATLQRALRLGWANVAEGSPEERAHTYGQLSGWDRRTPGEGTSRIDYVLANEAGRLLVRDFALLRDLPTPQHLGLRVTIDMNLAQQPARRLVPARP